MARWVKVASLIFKQQSLRGKEHAREQVLQQLQEDLENLKGLEIDLVVVSEGVEALTQTLAQAECVNEPGQVLSLYLQMANTLQCTIAGSVKIKEGNKAHNSIVYVGADDNGDVRILGCYHKTFLTQSELDYGLLPGQGAKVVDTPAGKLGGAICFDLNFTELCTQYETLKPQIIVFPSMYHGGLVQNQWAYRCRSFFISSLPFHGGGIIDPMGRMLTTTDCYSDVAIASINLDYVLIHLDDNQQHFDAIRKKYVGKINLDIPPNIGSAMLSSVSENLSAMDVAREFDLLLLDDYFHASRQSNLKAREGGIAIV